MRGRFVDRLRSMDVQVEVLICVQLSPKVLRLYTIYECTNVL